VGVSNHSFSYKRKGFPEANYAINVDGHDDAAQLFINGTNVWEHNGCCDVHPGVWEGTLGADDEVEFRVTEGGGGSLGKLSFVECPTTDILFVNTDATGNNDGTSWDDAFNFLQDALYLGSSCPGVSQIWVATGTYYPDEGEGYTDNDSTHSFVMSNNLAVYGGFDGSENPLTFNLADRDFVVNETILSGDIDQNDGPDFANYNNNSHHVVANLYNNLDNTAILDGFTVTGGNANFTGAGIINENAAPLLRNCIITLNKSDGFGGGMYNNNSSQSLSDEHLKMENCTLSNNSALGYGGAIMSYNAISLTNCEISGNHAVNGGGIAVYYGELEVINCNVNENMADSFGGGMNNSTVATIIGTSIENNEATNGGGVHHANATLTMTNCEIINNETSFQGAGINLQDCPNATLTNCLISGNISQNTHGGILNGSSGPDAKLYLINTTVAQNTSVTSGAIRTSGAAAFTYLVNTVVANNTPANFAQLGGGNLESQGNNLVSDGTSGFVDGVNGDLVGVDPLFISDTDFHLQNCSPAVDAGDDVANPEAFDLDGNPRKFEAIPGGSIIDMGAYERQTLTYAGEILYVNDDAGGANNGTSWDDAFTDLQDAFAQSCPNVSQIWVASGTYYPTTDTIRSIAFVLQNNLAVYGGFAGNEPADYDLSLRDFETNTSILSGDIGIEGDNMDNSYHIILNYNNNLDATAIIDGFTITGGNANLTSGIHTYGGGMYNFSSSPTVNNCNFINNYASYYGGGICMSFCASVFTNCDFTQNVSSHSGGAIFNWASEVVMQNCNFTDNSTLYVGGGISTHATLGLTANNTLLDCSFTGNNCTYGGGAINHGFGNSEGSGLFECTNCTFYNNFAYNGSNFGDGGAFFNEAIGFDGKFTNCLFDGNKGFGSDDWGGGTILVFEGNCSITNSTIVNSYSVVGGAAISVYSPNSTLELINSVLWNNTSLGSDNSISNNQGGTVVVENCLLQDNACPPDVTCGDGMIYNMDPLFVSTDDFHLLACSPAIDAGTDAGAPLDDLDGNPRPFSPMGYNPAAVDMGCYEYSIATDICATCPAVAFAGNDNGVFPGDSYTIADASAENYLSVNWITSGDGSFGNPDTLNPTYIPGPNDIAAGGVELTLSVEGLNSCGIGDNDQMFLTIYQPPSVEITYPFEGDVLYDYPLTVEGTAADINNDLTEVYVNLNGGGWELATGTYAWTKDLTLAIGENLIQAKAVDAQGLESEIAEVNVILSLQHIPLSQGWSIISSYLTPNDPALEIIMADVGIPENLTILVGKVGIYWPAYGINTIGDWNVFEGYKVKHQQADELIMHGDKLGNNDVTFSAGFHVIPVLSNVPAQISQIFVDPVNDVRYLFDLTSGLIYWPQGGIMDLEELIPGRGYLASFNKEVTIDYPDYSGLKSGVIYKTPVAINDGPWDYSRTAGFHQVSISHEAAAELKDVSHIGAFDSNGYCIGSVAINHADGNYLLTVFGDDETTTVKDGATEAEFMTFKAYNAQQNLEYEIIPEFSDKMPNVNGEFKTNGMSMITGFKEASTGFGGTSIAALQVELYPNPARDVVTLISHDYTPDAQFEAEFVNAGSKLAMKIELTGKSTNINLDDLNPGVYFVKITSQGGTVIKKLVIQ
jgi:hypothetical protein